MSSFLKSEIFEKSPIKTYINQAEISLKKIYEGTGNIQDVISSLDSNGILIDTKYYEINTEKLLGSFMNFIKKQLRLANENIKYKVEVSVTNAHYYSKKLITIYLEIYLIWSKQTNHQIKINIIKDFLN